MYNLYRELANQWDMLYNHWAIYSWTQMADCGQRLIYASMNIHSNYTELYEVRYKPIRKMASIQLFFYIHLN